MLLTRKQTEALDFLEDDITTEILLGGGAGGGKSLLGCFWILKICLKYSGIRCVIGRTELKTLKETTLQTFFEVAKSQGLAMDLHYRYNLSSMSIRFLNGSEILLKDLYHNPSDPEFDSLGSLEITAAFVDEVNQVSEKAWNILKSRIRFKLDDFGLVPKLLGTCNPSKGFLYGKFYQPFKEGKMPAGRVFIQSLLCDNPNVSEHYRANLLTLDQVTKERLLYGNWEFDDDLATLIPYDKIKDIFTNTHITGTEKYITCDVARFGKDRTIIMGWKGLAVTQIIELQGWSLDKTAEQITKLRHELGVGLSSVMVDQDGLGGGIMDFIKCKGFVNNGSPLEWDNQKQNFANLKSQCYFKLAEMINAGKVFVKTDKPEVQNAIIQELEQVKRRDIDKDGKLAVIPKDKVKEAIGRSPDYSDTMMMRMYYELKPEIKGLPISQVASFFH